MALPAYMYRDPADVAETNELERLGCSLCLHVAVTIYRPFCNHPKNEQQLGFPWKGYRCRLFESNEKMEKSS